MYTMHMKSELFLFNTATRTRERFTPIHADSVGIYSCGPTVYHYQHLGNMRAVVCADVLHRVMLYAGYTVLHVNNITDVGHLVGDGNDGQDKLEKGAAREGKSAWDIAAFYTEAYFSDIEALNVNRSEYFYPRATGTIQEQIDMIATLEKKGHTYRTSDGIYFDTHTFPAYAAFARLDITHLKSGARVEENTEKRNITDFALWKFSYSHGRPFDPAQDDAAKQRHMEWDSPWGTGSPGWHIECSAMSRIFLGNHFDIHTGGIDHIPVHHTNEIAQSECTNGEPYVNYWLHNNFLNDADGKMAKSKGDFLRLQSVIDAGIPPLAFRYYLLTTQYRKEIEFSFEALRAATTAYTKLYEWMAAHTGEVGTVLVPYQEKYVQALYDDMNTPQAIAVMWDLLKDKDVQSADIYATILDLDRVLGLDLTHARHTEKNINDTVKTLLAARKQARDEKNFVEADRLRDEIATHGFMVKDTADGQIIE